MDESSTAVNGTEGVDTSTASSAVAEKTESTDVTDFSQVMEQELNQDEGSNEDGSEAKDGAGAQADDKSTDNSDAQQQPKPSVADQRKEQLSAEIRQMVAEKHQREQELAALQQTLAQAKAPQVPKTMQEYLETVNPETGDYYTPEQAKVEMLQNELQSIRNQYQQDAAMRQLTAQVNSLSSDVDKVLADYPMFDAESDQYNEALSRNADMILAANLVRDNNGRVIGSRVPIYSIYKSLADTYNAGSSIGQADAQKATTKMLSRVDVGSSATNKTEDEEGKFVKGFFD